MIYGNQEGCGTDLHSGIFGHIKRKSTASLDQSVLEPSFPSLHRDFNIFTDTNIAVSNALKPTQEYKIMWLKDSIFFGTLLILVHHQAVGQTANDGMDCVNPKGQDGNCRNIRACPPIAKLLYDSSAHEFIRQSWCGWDGTIPLVCCPDARENPIEMNNNNNNNNNASTNKRNNVEKNSNNAPERYGPLFAPECGTTNSTYSRIVRGLPAKLGSWPWAVLLGYQGTRGVPSPQWKCGGSLISSRHILTAAHCVHGQRGLYIVRLGELDLEDEYEGATPIDILIETSTIHPEYSRKNIINDIAVLRLEKNVRFTDLIRPICLPLAEKIRNLDLTGAYPSIVGWGSIKFRGPTSSKLLEVNLPVWSQNDCKEIFKPHEQVTIDDRVVCAGGSEGKDACQGDSGGPMMFPFRNAWYSIGVVSFGRGCATPGYPGVYTRTSAFLDFILPLLK